MNSLRLLPLGPDRIGETSVRSDLLSIDIYLRVLFDKDKPQVIDIFCLAEHAYPFYGAV